MPKLSFKIPEQKPEEQASADETHTHWLGLVGVVAVVSIVGLVMLFQDAITTGYAIQSPCPSNVITADNLFYVDQLEKLGHKCFQTGVPGIWCCSNRR